LKEQKRYIAGIYCRLSKDDIGEGDSSSILTQKSMLEKFINDNGWTVYDRYIDDGYSGTNFNRPDFQRMLDDIENEKINMVVVKDLSRLGRNYLMTGQYTEIYFPDRGVRFIALNDGIDTINSDNDIAPFKNILNEMYSKDISKKVRSAVQAKKQRGEFLSNYAPFGYIKDPLNKNHLIIDEGSAEVVKRIFGMCCSGLGSKLIAKRLNEEGVLSPSNYRMKLQNCGARQKSNHWHPETVVNILRNRVYLGDMVQGIYECSRFRRTPSKRKPQEEWVVTPNMHEPIVDLETWEHVQTLINSRKRVLRSNELQLFAGFLKCEDCGYALTYSRSQNIEQYSCGQYRRHGKSACSCHYIRKDTLMQVVLDDIRKYAMMVQADEEGFATQLADLGESKDSQRIQALQAQLKIAKARYSELDRLIEKLFEESAMGRMSDSRYQKLSIKYEAEQMDLEKQIQDCQSEISRIQQNQQDTSAWLALIKDYADIKELDRIVLSELIDRIIVGETKVVDGKKTVNVTIYYRFVGAIGQTATGEV
jgi:DNA invertase Pin-like site-specific DNA recombinase